MEQEQKPRRLSSYADTQLPNEYLKLELIADKEVTIVGGHVGNGKFGEFAVMDIVVEAGVVQTFMTSGFLVVDALRKALVEDALPCQVKFTRPNRCWRME